MKLWKCSGRAAGPQNQQGTICWPAWFWLGSGLVLVGEIGLRVLQIQKFCSAEHKTNPEPGDPVEFMRNGFGSDGLSHISADEE